MKPSKVETAGKNVKFVGKLDKRIYRCITDNIITDEVIITEERIAHIEENHPGDYMNYGKYLPEAVQAPNYIFAGNRPNTALILKQIPASGERFKTILKLITSDDTPAFKNSVITFMKTDEREWNRLTRNKKILYKSE